MSVHRKRPLPLVPSRGKLLVPDEVVSTTQQHLRRVGSGNNPHEGLVWLVGRQISSDTLVISSYPPEVQSGFGHVLASEEAVGIASRKVRSLRLGIVAQVHSHPGSDTRHSDGDDDLVLMPFEGMFSLVIGDYGHGSMLPVHGAGLHQFQDGRWIQVNDADAMLVIPSEL